MGVRIFPRFALGLLAVLSPAMLRAETGEYVYVSPEGCDLSGNGSSASPYYSLSKAVEGRLDGRSDTLFVMVAAGDYEMTAPFVISGEVSRPVVIRGVGDGKPSFSGGVRIDGWEPCGDGLYRAFVPEVARYGFTFEQFYVDGRRAVLARTPDSGWYQVKGAREQAYVAGVRAPEYAVQRVDFDPADWTTLDGVSVDELADLKFRFYHKWDITHKRADFIDVDSGFVYTRGEGMKPWNPIRKGSRYIMYDYFGALTEPGEWYLDRRSAYLYYMPEKG